MRPRIGAVLLAFLLAPAVLRGAPREPLPFAIKDARIVVGPGKTLERATIVFRSGLVAAVGPDARIPQDAIVEDGRGLVVYPGFLDAFASFPLEPTAPEAVRAREGAQPNLQEDPPISTPEARRKGVRPSLDVAASVVLEGDRRVKERQAGFAAALAVPPRGYLAGKSAVLALGDRPRRDSIVLSRAFLHASFDGPEAHEWSYPHTLIGAHAHIRQAFADARRKRELDERAEKGATGPRAAFDLDLDALLPAIDRRERLLWRADTPEDVERVLRFGKELGVRLAISDARHAAKSAPLLRREGVPAIVSLAWGPAPKPATREADPAPPPKKGHDGRPLLGPFLFQHFFFAVPCSIQTAPPIGPEKPPPAFDPTQESRAAFEEREQKRKDEVRNLRDLFLAGVRVAVSSEGIEPNQVRERLREAIKEGLPEEAAVAALTWDAAAVLGLERRLGTLEPGKLGFATVLTGTLGDEKARVKLTVVDGERVDAEKLEDDARLARLAGRFKLEAGPVSGLLVLEVLGGKLVGRIEVEPRSFALTQLSLEGDKLAFAIPKEVFSGKNDAKTEARWVSPDVLEGTTGFEEGARAFRAVREPK